MNIRHTLFSLLVLIGISSAAHAQIHGLSITDTAEPPGKGTVHIVGSAFEAETSSLYGGRIAYGASDRLLVFTDLGVNDVDNFDPEFLGQAGMRYTLPVNLPFDLAVRATTIPYIASYEHYVEFTLSLLASRFLDSRSVWAVYGAVGIDRQWWELYVPAYAYVDKGNSTDVAVSIGISRKLYGPSRIFIETSKNNEV